MAYLRDRRAFGNIGTRKFRGARFGDALSPRFSGLLDQYGGAAAAYSLRALSSGWLAGDVVRVRRESDNGERNFNASGVSSGELVNWVNQQITPPLDLRELTATGRDGPIIEAAAAYSLRNLSDSYAGSVVEVRRNTDGALKDFKASEVTDGTLAAWVNTSFANALPLDTAGAAAAAYSLRNLSSSYTGSVVEVRRGSDGNTESFTAVEVTDGTLVAWVGAGNDGTVSKWYDQSGNDNHATQGTPASQPKIVSGGSLVTGGLAFDGANGGLRVAGPVLTSSSFFTTSVIRHDTGTSNTNSENVYGQYQSSTSGRWQLSANTSNAYSFFANAANNISSLSAGALGTSQTLISVNANGSNAEIFRDGTSKATDTYSGFTPATVDFTIGFDSINLREFNGKIQELIIYPTDQSDKRRAIEENIGSNYGITLTSSKDGTVSKWYDQSTTSGVPNANHAVQTSAAKQPKIVDGGSLVTGGLTFDGVNDHFTCPSLYSANLSVFTKATTDNTNAGSFMRFLHICDGSDSFQITRGGDADIGRFQSKNTSFQSGFDAFNHGSISGNSLLTSITSGSATESYANGSLRSNVFEEIGDGGNATTTIGARSDLLSTSFFNNAIQEIIIYPDDQTDNRTALEANIGEVYGIAGIPAYDNTVNGFVETWYDQSGNGNDAVQLTAGSQPKIVNAGTLVAGGLDFDGTNDFMQSAAFTSTPQPITRIGVANFAGSGTRYVADGSASNRGAMGSNSAGKWRIFSGTVGDYVTGPTNSSDYLMFAMYSGASSQLYVNSTGLGVKDVGTADLDQITIGVNAANSTNGLMNGTINEVIVYGSDQTANRVAIEANINNQYDIY